ncbi:MAG: group III truncated hemoglobin [Flavobacteriales bacterium]|nr:group III truncated hemoglobin [Flavobacteriales bacterium]
MRDIETKEDLACLMEAFYSKMLKDEIVGYIFTDVAKLDLKKHLPSLTNFWENMLLNANGYKKDVMGIHLNLNKQENLKSEHFERWLLLLSETVNEQFYGETANKMLKNAQNIAKMMQIKLKM